MLTKAEKHRYFNSPCKTSLLCLSLVALVLNLITFYGLYTFGTWVQLRYPVMLVVAAVALLTSQWWSYLLAAFLSPNVFFGLGYHMLLEWRDYRYDGASFEDSLRGAFLPLWESLTAVLAVIIFFSAVFYFSRSILRIVSRHRDGI